MQPRGSDTIPAACGLRTYRKLRILVQLADLETHLMASNASGVVIVWGTGLFATFPVLMILALTSVTDADGGVIITWAVPGTRHEFNFMGFIAGVKRPPTIPFIPPGLP